MSKTAVKYNYNGTFKIIDLPTDQINQTNLASKACEIFQLDYTNLDMFNPSPNHVYCILKEYRETKQEKIKISKEDRIYVKYSNPKQYLKLDITDPLEIDLFRSKLIELHFMGYKRFFFNLKNLVSYRNGNDLSGAVLEIKKTEDLRYKKKEQNRELRREEKYNNNFDDETKNNNNNFDAKRERKDRKNKNFDEKREKNKWKKRSDDVWDSTKTGELKYEIFDVWPKGAYSVLYIDGNNMMFLTEVLRNNTLGRRRKRSEMIIYSAVEEFAKMNYFDLVVVIFDNTKQVFERVLESGTKFAVMSARPQYETSDDALVVFNEKQSEDVRKRSLVVTSDRGLTIRLTDLSVHVTKCKNFLNAIQKEMNRITGGLNEWLTDIDQNLQ
jgi:hypothetical protein